jgi:hypothetical protein
MKRRAILAGLAGAVLASGAYFSVGPPRITLLNASLVLEYPWLRGAAAFACAMSVTALATLVDRPVSRRTGFVLALGPLLVAAHLLLYRLEAGSAGLASRGVLGTTTIAWHDVLGVELGATAVLVRGGGEHSIRIDTSDFAPEQRATVERTLARHVRENGGTGIVTVP